MRREQPPIHGEGSGIGAGNSASITGRTAVRYFKPVVVDLPIDKSAFRGIDAPQIPFLCEWEYLAIYQAWRVARLKLPDNQRRWVWIDVMWMPQDECGLFEFEEMSHKQLPLFI